MTRPNIRERAELALRCALVICGESSKEFEQVVEGVRGPRKLDHFGCEVCRVSAGCTVRFCANSSGAR